MKTADVSSTHSQQHQAEQSTSTQEHDQAFFSEQSPEPTPFFTSAGASGIQTKLAGDRVPFFQPTKVPPIQAKCDACAEEEQPSESPDLQRIPAFESDKHPVQAKMVSGAVGPNIQRMPAFESDEQHIQAKSIDSTHSSTGSESNGASTGDATLQTNSVQGTQPSSTAQSGSLSHLQDQNDIELEDDAQEDMMLQGKYADDLAVPSGEEDNTNSSNQVIPNQFIQPKLIIGQPNDVYEREADAMADRVISTPVQESLRSPSENSQQGIQKQAITDKNNEVNDPQIEPLLASTKTGGRPLEPEVLEEMEGKFDADFTHVRVHTNKTAAELSNSLNAKAFTHGQHIYFNSGNYDPISTEGKRLLAHELAHVIQQTGRAERKLIQRANDGEENSENIIKVKKKGAYYGTWLDLNASPRHLNIPKVSIPEIKSRHSSLYKSTKLIVRRESRDESKTKQRTNWLNDSELLSAVEKHLTNKIREAENRGGVNKNGVYFFRARRNRNFILLGQRAELLKLLKIPTWDKAGNFRRFQVDHAVEHQLGGKDDITNYELLDARTNASSGSRLKNQINKRIRGAIKALGAEAHPRAIEIKNLSTEHVRKTYEVEFKEFDFKLPNIGGEEPHLYWGLNDIKRGTQAKALRALTGEDVKRLGDTSKENIFTGPSGGTMFPIPKEPKEEWIPQIKFVDWESSNPDAEANAQVGNLKVIFFYKRAGRKFPIKKKDATDPEQTIPVKKIPGVAGGYIAPKDLTKGMHKRLQFNGLSPIEIEHAEISGRKGLFARGQILPTVPFIEKANIELLILGKEIQLRKTFDMGEINIPPPFKLKDSSLSVFYSNTKGLGIEGETGFEIQQVGEGRIGAAKSTKGGLALDGEFNFDSKLFDPAQVKVSYRDNTFGVAGTIGIPKGKVKGIKSAKITVAYSKETFTAAGEAELDIPGVERGTLAVTYSDNGWSIGGSFALSDDIPGIRGGSVEAKVSRDPSQEGYQVYIKGEAEPNIPGLSNTKLSVEYDNGALTIKGSASFNKGLLSGSVNVGATNRVIGDDGNPTDEVGKSLVFYGGGTLSLKLTSWLKGTAGVQFLPNGELQVKGEIGLPETADVFDRIAIPEKELFSLGFDIPIFAIPVGPKSIGLKASIRGGIKAGAGIGPGRLEDTKLGIEYNPAQEDQTHLYGSARFVVPADAGLKFFVEATIGLDALIGGVEGGLELSAGLGLKAEASAGVNVDWTPTSGLKLNANLAAHIQPKLSFDIDGLIRAWVGVWPVKYTKTWKWKLASFEFGSNMRAGIELPIHYEDNKPLNIAFEDIKFTRPKLDKNFLKGLIRAVKNRRA